MQKSRKSLLFVVLCASAIVAWFLPLHDTLSNWHAVGVHLSPLGAMSQTLFVLAVAVLCAIGMPRLLAYVIGGLAFDFLWGLLLAQAGAMVGAYATFIFARWSGSDLMLRDWPRLPRFRNVVGNCGIVSVLMLRQMPLNSFLPSVLIGLSTISHRDFLVGSFIGFLPAGIPAVLLGSGLPTGNVDLIVKLSLAVAVLLVFFVWLFRLLLLRFSSHLYSGWYWRGMLLVNFCAVAGFLLYFSNGIPVLGMWEPGIRLDVSGVEAVEGTDFLLAANDRGRLKGLSGFLVPSVVLVDLQHYPHITSLHLDTASDVAIPDKKWDAESLRCQLRNSGEVLCFVVSGRLRHLLWMVAPSVAAVREGQFAIQGYMDIGNVLAMTEKQEIESISFTNTPSAPVKLLLLGRYPELVAGKLTDYPAYTLTFTAEPLSTESVSAARVGALPLDICQSVDHKTVYGNRVSDLARLDNTQSAILVCSQENPEFSYLVPVTFTASGIAVDPVAPAMRIGKEDFDGHPPKILKVEGVSCLQGDVVISIDSDSYEGGVYRLSKKFSSLCQR